MNEPARAGGPGDAQRLPRSFGERVVRIAVELAIQHAAAHALHDPQRSAQRGPDRAENGFDRQAAPRRPRNTAQPGCRWGRNGRACRPRRGPERDPQHRGDEPGSPSCIHRGSWCCRGRRRVQSDHAEIAGKRRWIHDGTGDRPRAATATVVLDQALTPCTPLPGPSTIISLGLIKLNARHAWYFRLDGATT